MHIVIGGSADVVCTIQQRMLHAVKFMACGLQAFLKPRTRITVAVSRFNFLIQEENMNEASATPKDSQAQLAQDFKAVIKLDASNCRFQVESV